jgi:hypothetical protein
MSKEKILKSNQEQAVAAWVNYLNQTRINELTQALLRQTENFTEAMQSLDFSLETIRTTIVERNRGGTKGMHGFIAEVAEVGVVKAKEQIQGNHIDYEWVNDNGHIDLLRDGIAIQQKFVNSGDHLSLRAINEHLKKYPDYLNEGGLYQIPRNHFEKIQELLSMPKEVADKMPTSTGEFSLKQWKEVHQFFDEGKVPRKAIEPSALSYDEVQANRYEETIAAQKKEIRQIDRKIRDNAQQKSKPTLQEGVKVTLVAGVIEGGTTFAIEVTKKIKAGKKITEFDKDDWKDIAGDSGKSVVKGNIRGASIYALTNFKATPAAVASAMVTASFGVAEQAHLFRIGELSEQQFIQNSVLLCLDASVSALSSFLGQVVIPVPVIGAVIGNTIGMTLYKISKDGLSSKEQELIKQYSDELQQLDEDLHIEYGQYLELLQKNYLIYLSLLEDAFAPDPYVAFEGSIKLAKSVGVPTEEILDTPDKIASYFLD